MLTFAKGCPNEREKGKYREIHRIADEAEVIPSRSSSWQYTPDRSTADGERPPAEIKLFEVAVKIDDQPCVISQKRFMQGLPIPTHLKDKDILLLDIDEKDLARP